MFVITACQKKSSPLITEREAVAPKKIGSNYPPKSNAAVDTVAGRQLFTQRCGRCHGLPEPRQFNVSQWESILPLMFPRTRLSEEQAFHVRAYLLSSARK